MLRNNRFLAESRRRLWSLSTLEKREMLAADAGAAVSSAATSDTSSASVSLDIATTQTEASPTSTSASELVLIDSDVAAAAEVMPAILNGADVVLLDNNQDAIEQISQILAGRQNLRAVHLVTHGDAGQIKLGNQSLTLESIEQNQSQVKAWSQAMIPGGDLLIYGCDVASGDMGARLIDRLASVTGLDVAASSDRTGHGIAADWEMERVVGNVETAPWIANNLLASMTEHLGIEIYAAGSMGDELMELEINGQIVETWFVRDTDAEAGQFLRYFVDRNGVSANDIKINFVNDQYDPARGIDRNLRIDRIVVDGVTYQAEHPSVFGTGIWVSGTGITSGNLQSEYINANGSLSFSSSGASGGGGGTGSNVEVSLQGSTGQENAEVLIDGRVVQTYQNISSAGQVFSFRADGTITADRVRVAFTNDLFSGTTDRNLTVDFIRIDGNTFQTEAATTFSTGTWKAEDGVVSGFRQSDTLHSNGYFQYLASNSGNPGNAGSFSLTTSDVTVNEGQSSVTLTVSRLGGSTGAVSVGYYTGDRTATAGQDYVAQSGRLNFANGQTTQTITIGILSDSASEGTEIFNVFLDSPVGANLLTPRTASVSIADDDVGLPNYVNFADASTLDLNGVSWTRYNRLYLVGNAVRQAGSAFHTTPIPFNSNTSFQAAFEFQIGGPFGTTGNSGFTFTLQGSSRGTSALGGFGSYLGYSGIENSIAIEFDSERQSWDTRAQSVSVLRNGIVETELAGVASPVVLNADRPYFAWVDYDGDAKQLRVYLSTTNSKPATALLSTTLDLSTILTGPVYAGFTAGNVDKPNYHSVASFTMNLNKPDPVNQNPDPGQIVKRDIISGLNQPLAVEWSADGRNLYIAEKEGVIKVVRDGGSVQTVIDISGQVNHFNDRGLIDFALHPDLQNNPYLYLSYTYDPPQVYDNVGNALAGPDGSGNRAGRLTRVTLNAATNYTTIVPNSETILVGSNSTWNNFNAFVDSTTNLTEPEGGRVNGQFLRDFINSDSQSHTVGSLVFGNDGALYFSIGDGAGYTQQDNRALRVQNLDSLSGKVLRIDPITGRGLSDNPFYNGDPNSNRSKVYQLGLRNPWRLSYDPINGRLLSGDTGWASFEEINTGGAGTNFGWPYYEGRTGVNEPTPFYRTLAAAQQFYASGQGTPPTVSLAHSSGSNTIVLGGYIQDSNLGAQYDGGYFYNDLFRGTIRYFKLDSSGRLIENRVFRTDGQFIVDLQEGPDGNLYYVNLVEGTVGRYQLG